MVAATYMYCWGIHIILLLLLLLYPPDDEMLRFRFRSPLALQRRASPETENLKFRGKYEEENKEKYLL